MSSPKPILIVPGEEFGAGSKLGVRGYMDFISMERFILLPVVKFLTNSTTDFKVVVGCYSGVASIQKPMEV